MCHSHSTQFILKYFAKQESVPNFWFRPSKLALLFKIINFAVKKVRQRYACLTVVATRVVLKKLAHLCRCWGTESFFLNDRICTVRVFWKCLEAFMLP